MSTTTHTCIQGVILDLDGTLLDSMSLWHAIDIQFLTENGIAMPEGFSELVAKMSITEWSEYFVRTFSMPYEPAYVVRRVEELAAQAYRDSVPMKPYVPEFLDFLDAHGIPFGVATANYRKPARDALERLGILSRMRFLLTGEDMTAGKTSPDIFLAAADRLGTVPARTLVTEDSLHCVETASAAGFCTAAVHDSCTPEGDWRRMQRISTLYGEDLREVMQKLSGLL